MEKRDARLFQSVSNVISPSDTPDTLATSETTETSETIDTTWNIVELDSHRELRQQVHELITIASSSSITTDEMRQRLLQGVVMFGKRFATQLVRSLQRDDQQERQSVVWLLTLLNDKETLSPLQQMTQNKRLPRAIRLSAALAIAGMGATKEVAHNGSRRVRLYAIR